MIVNEELLSQVQLAKTDKYALNTLLHNYLPFIKKCIKGVFYNNPSKADNLTDAMLAFAHSVKTYNSGKGAFIRYAAMVIRSRLIDNARKELSVQKRFSLFSFKTDTQETAWETDISIETYNREEEERNLSAEIEAANIEFSRWGFSWEILLKKCPKQERSRYIASQIAQSILKESSLLEETLKTCRLPYAYLTSLFSRNIIEKYRHYIAALIILSKGDYPYVYSFLPQHFTEEENI